MSYSPRCVHRYFFPDIGIKKTEGEYLMSCSNALRSGGGSPSHRCAGVLVSARARSCASMIPALTSSGGHPPLQKYPQNRLSLRGGDLLASVVGRFVDGLAAGRSRLVGRRL